MPLFQLAVILSQLYPWPTSSIKIYVGQNPNTNWQEQNREIHRAFEEFERKTCLKFEFVGADSQAQIRVEWLDIQRDSALAQTYLPYPASLRENEGRIQLNTKYEFKILALTEMGEVDLFAVLMHELGHAVGIYNHSQTYDSVLFPFMWPVRKLDGETIDAISKIYSCPSGSNSFNISVRHRLGSQGPGEIDQRSGFLCRMFDGRFSLLPRAQGN